MLNKTWCNWILSLLLALQAIDLQAASSPSNGGLPSASAQTEAPPQSSQNTPLATTPTLPAPGVPSTTPSTQNPSLTPNQQAPNPLSPTQSTQQPVVPNNNQNTQKPEAEVDPQRGLKNLIAMMAGCELDNQCLRNVLMQVAQTDPDPIYQPLLTYIQGQKEDLNCRTPEIVAVKKATAACLGDLVNQSKDLKMDMNVCFRNKMEALAKDRNIFAQSALLNIARKANDTQSINGWKTMIEAEIGTSQYAAYQKCPSPLELLEQLSTVMSLRPKISTIPVQPLTPVTPLPSPKTPSSPTPGVSTMR